MPKIPRNITGRELIKLLSRYDYRISRERGSHIRISSNFMGSDHNLTIPDHRPIKIGTLNNILKDISDYLKISKQALVEKLFE